MSADNTSRDYEELLRRSSTRGAAAERQPHDRDPEAELGEESCLAFGFLRGLTARAAAIEFRFRNGDSDWYAYSLLASWRYNPSVGLLLKFTGGDVVTLVLIRGSNLDAVVEPHGVNLTDRGLQRHRITHVSEMDEDALRKAGGKQPTIDRIDIQEFESSEEVQDWLKKAAPVFVRPSR